MTPNPATPAALPAEPNLPPDQPDELHTALSEARRELDALRAALDSAERRRAIERALLHADAIDLETAALLTESAIASAGVAAGVTNPDTAISTAVADLKRRKPFLFARRTPLSSTMAPRHGPDHDPLVLSREHAAATGDRTSLLRYLRLRRSA